MASTDLAQLFEKARCARGNREVATEDGLRRYCATCATLFANIEDRCPGAGSVFKRLFAVLSYLAPWDKGMLPDAMIQDLRRLVEQVDAGLAGPKAWDEDLIVDLGLAITGGWGSMVSAGKSGWDRPWPDSVAVLNDMTMKIVADFTRGLITRRIKGGPLGFQKPSDEDNRGWAVTAVIETIFGRGTGVRDLRQWQPGQQRLGVFLCQVLLGSSVIPKQIQAHAFQEGHLCKQWAAEARVQDPSDSRETAFILCLKCGSNKGEFHNQKCPKCGPKEPEEYYVIGKAVLVTPLVYVVDQFRKFTPESLPGSVSNYILQGTKDKGRDRPREVYYLDSIGTCPHAVAQSRKRGKSAPDVSQRTTELLVRNRDRGPEVILDRDPDGKGSTYDVMDSRTSDPAGVAADTEQELGIRRWLEGLPEPTRTVMQEHLCEESSVQDIAKNNNMSVDVVQRLILEARLDGRIKLGPFL
jgi:hypothetical protein